MTVTADGGLRAERVRVTRAEIAAGVTAKGRRIVETEADIAELDAGNIRAQSAAVAEIFTAALTAGRITAGEAFVASAAIPQLYATAIRALGDSLDISANESVRIVVGEAVDGLRVGGRNYLRGSKTMADPRFFGWIDRPNIAVVDDFVIDTVNVV